jgi:hypothetical protein
MPIKQFNDYGEIIAVGSVSQQRHTEAPPRYFPDGGFWLVNSAAGIVALRHACPNGDHLLSWNNSAGQFTCPSNSSRFDRNGDALTLSGTRSLDRYVIQIVNSNGDIMAETDFGTGDPVRLDSLQKRIPHQSPSLPSSNSSADGATRALAVHPPLLVQVDTGRVIRGNTRISPFR